jgi:1-acyl-sn-glycerol-3-phosphate acyltransferase
MRATKLQTFLITIKIICTTLYNSLYVLWLALFHGSTKRPLATRDRINAITLRWSRRLLGIVRARLTVFNPHQTAIAPNQPYIIMSNHLSHYDIPLIFASFPHNSVRMIAKKELFKVPIWGAAMKTAEFFTVDRGNSEQAKQFLKVACDKMASGIVPWIAPEGTRSRNGEMQAFKKGGFILAIETGATIIPVGIRHSNKILPAKTLTFGIGEDIEVHIGKPIPTANSHYSITNIRQLMQDVAAQIQNAATNPSNTNAS